MSKEYKLSQAELRQLQFVLLDILAEFDRVCVTCGIPYSIAGGTLLGAVRHNGFIPWDDDIDVVLLRRDYERLARVFDENTDSDKYYFQDADNTPGYRWGYGKIRRKGTLWTRLGQEHLPYKQEIFIDVIPLDAVPDGKITAKVHNFHCFVLRKSLWSEVGKLTDGNPLKRLVFAVLSAVPLNVILKRLSGLAGKYNKRKCERLRVLTIPTPKGYDFEGKFAWYESFTDLEFEGRTFKAMAAFEDYLKLKYGDYMTLPPADKREVHPVSALKLPESEVSA